ncbi:MAG: peptide chain release factor N(5)-glutamine methyltransferase [Candidatus Rokubacteria bacterium]|nr:peptide chain release factor N(5)-glutamine methyltransferase [Candidatus Rokubacteria bacterium]
MTTALSALSVGTLLRESVRRLEVAVAPSARQDAEWLLAAALGVERFHLYLEPAQEVAASVAARVRGLVERRAAHEPLQHLLGFEDFRGLRLRVTPDVLIPRPETEGLVEWALEMLAPLPRPVVADVGTGSGAIACALAAACPALEVVAIDSSLAALAVATANVRALGLAPRVHIVAGDLLAPLAALAGAVDAIVANPPYLPSGSLPSLPPEVARFEPRLALDGGPDGLRVIRRIVGTAPRVLRPGGALVMEIGEEQAGSVASLLAAEGFSGIEARRDLRGVERYVAGWLGD